MYLSQLSTIPKEEILQFRNLGNKTIAELEQICQEYDIQIRSLSSLKEAAARTIMTLEKEYSENHETLAAGILKQMIEG